MIALLGGLAYWLTLPKVITQPYLLYGESCYMNSRSCDATRMLWCPAGTCICIGDFQWNSTAQNCSCGLYQQWVNVKCQDYGSYGDPCNTVPCKPTLTCLTVINQTFTTGQSICVCDNTTYLSTSGTNQGTCIPRLGYNAICLTNSDCQSWLGLSCTRSGSKYHSAFHTRSFYWFLFRLIALRCLCSSQSYWNGSICARSEKDLSIPVFVILTRLLFFSDALGWQACSGSVPCDTSVGLTCTAGLCQCDALSYWDNVTTLTCLPRVIGYNFLVDHLENSVDN